MTGSKSVSPLSMWVWAVSSCASRFYMDDLLHQGGDPHWGYCGAGLLKHDERIRDVMRLQECLYTLVERSLEGDKARIIGSIVNFLFAPDDPQKVIEQMASAETRIISLTITEGGYYIDQATGNFNEKHPDIQHDLVHPHEPRCSFGYSWRLSIAGAFAGCRRYFDVLRQHSE